MGLAMTAVDDFERIRRWPTAEDRFREGTQLNKSVARVNQLLQGMTPSYDHLPTIRSVLLVTSAGGHGQGFSAPTIAGEISPEEAARKQTEKARKQLESEAGELRKLEGELTAACSAVRRRLETAAEKLQNPPDSHISSSAHD